MPNSGAEPAPPTPPVAAPVRRRAVPRGVMVLGGSLQPILALIITVASGLWAWSLAATEFAGPPQLADQLGVIGVGVESSGPTVHAPITISAVYTPPANADNTRVQLIFDQVVEGSARKQPSPTIVVFLCGSVAEKPVFHNNRFQPVQWRALKSPAGIIVDSVFGILADCKYTTLHLATGAPGTGGFRQALLLGSVGETLSDTSGTKVLYALPGIASWSVPEPINGVTPSGMPPGSTLAISLAKDKSDFENLFASPQLANVTSITWKADLGGTATPIEDYRLEADSATALSRLQFHLFLAGALVGVAGGAFVWFLQLCGQAGYAALAARAKRRIAVVQPTEPSAPAAPEAPASAAPRRYEQDGAGLGWPS